MLARNANGRERQCGQASKGVACVSAGVGATSGHAAGAGRAGTSVSRTRSARLHFLPLQQLQPREMEPNRATICVLVQN